MFAGTGSDVGKSVIATAFCRIFRQDGYAPAPFKAQNMALNSSVTTDGGEIGRAQAVQAEAAGVPCCTDMNPILLKPQSDHTSQIVLGGKVAGVSRAADYFKREGREALRAAACAAFDRLAARYNPIVMEGAGSMTELNLRDIDIVNLPMAAHAGADVILIGDIDRGGVFASLYGSVALLQPAERRLVKGIIINKFRGDMGLFASGVDIIERLCGVPVLGIVPYMRGLSIEEEDSVALTTKAVAPEQGKINIAVVSLRHISNFTDFDPLEHDPRVHLFYAADATSIERADIVILPGTKSTADDLLWLRRSGAAEAVWRARRRGATVMGICGGYQIMGEAIADPQHADGDIERMSGLGLLPVTTVMRKDKRTVRVNFTLHPDALALASLITDDDGNGQMHGYEIHNGETALTGRCSAYPLTRFADGTEDGCITDTKCMGTYVHGILDNRAFVDFLLAPYADKCGERTAAFDYAAFREEQYDRIAGQVRESVDMNKVYSILSGGEGRGEEDGR